MIKIKIRVFYFGSTLDIHSVNISLQIVGKIPPAFWAVWNAIWFMEVNQSL
jgi:hypothetical protein